MDVSFIFSFRSFWEQRLVIFLCLSIQIIIFTLFVIRVKFRQQEYNNPKRTLPNIVIFYSPLPFIFFSAEAFMNAFVFCNACLPVYTCFSYFPVIPYKRENNKQFGSLVTSTNWYKIYFPIFSFLYLVYFKDSVW